MTELPNMYVIWCTDKEEYMHELSRMGVYPNETGILLFTSLETAQRRAALAYGYDTYEEVFADGWVEIRKL